jgi:hypothetical protein
MNGEEGGGEERDHEKYLAEHPEFVRQWILEHGDSKLVSALLEKQQRSSSLNNGGCSDEEEGADDATSLPVRPIPRSKRNSVTSDLFQMLVTSPQRKSSR